MLTLEGFGTHHPQYRIPAIGFQEIQPLRVANQSIAHPPTSVNSLMRKSHRHSDARPHPAGGGGRDDRRPELDRQTSKADFLLIVS